MSRVERWVTGGHVTLLGSALVAIACTAGELPSDRMLGPPAEQQMVAGQAAADMGANGYFSVAHRPLAGAPEEIPADAARRLAAYWVNNLAIQVRPTLEKDRGGAIAFGELQPCGRVFYASTPFRVSDMDVHPLALRGFSPMWLVAFCGPDGSAHLSVGVRAWTDTKLEGGRLEIPSGITGAFVPMGVPLDPKLYLPSPEEAVQLVHDMTGAKVVSTPELLLLPRGMPQLARWLISIEASAAVRAADGQLLESRDFVVAFNPEVRRYAVGVPARTQPESLELQTRLNATGGRQAPRRITVPFRDDVPINVTFVTKAE